MSLFGTDEIFFLFFFAYFTLKPTLDFRGRLLATSTKLKLAAYTEVLITDDPVTYTIGPAWKITSYAFVEVSAKCYADFSIAFNGFLI